MNKKEKYINYIIDDMVKKTEIYYDQEIIKLPFLSSTSLSFSPFPPSTLRPRHSLHSFFISYPSTPFSNHVRKVYGAHSEEIEFIWDQYKERIHSLIKK